MSVHTWGLGKSGQLGNGKLDNCLVPGLVSLPTKSDVVGISSGGLFTACVTADGRVYTFGCGKYGRLGNNREEDSKTPVRVEKLADCHITKVRQWRLKWTGSTEVKAKYCSMSSDQKLINLNL